MADLSTDMSDHLCVFVLTGFRFVLLDDATAFEGFEGQLETDLG